MIVALAGETLETQMNKDSFHPFDDLSVGRAAIKVDESPNTTPIASTRTIA
jgi:hypothetical protein